MRNKKEHKQKGVIQHTHYDNGNVFYRNYVNLSNNRFMLITRDSHKNLTSFKIICNTQPNESLVEKTLKGHFEFLAIFPDGSFLLAQSPSDNYKNSLVKMSSSKC